MPPHNLSLVSFSCSLSPSFPSQFAISRTMGSPSSFAHKQVGLLG